MSVYIKDMEIPDSCNHCFVTPGCCPAVRKRIKSDKPGYKWIPANYRHEDCPLIEVPEPHGNLIDADEIFVEFVIEGQRSKRYKLGEKWELNGEEIRSVISRLPTIIPASEEAE